MGGWGVGGEAGCLDELLGESGGELGVAFVDQLNGLDEFFGGGVLEEVACGSGLEGAGDVFGVVEGGEDEDFGVGVEGDDRTCGCNPVHDGHSDVHENHVGGDGFEEGDRGFSVFRFADDFKIGFGFEQGAESSADEGLIVY